MSAANGQTPQGRATLSAASLFVYKNLLSPLLHGISGSPTACRFQPSCSEYAVAAIAHHGIFRGTWLAVRRIAKCHPFHRPEFDPVPGTWSPALAIKQTSVSPFTIEETGSAPGAALQPSAATLPHEPEAKTG
jgi:putative membrane protein insertion efficiency factor